MHETPRIEDLGADLEEALEIRHRVFVLEQGVPVEEERDELDAVALHLLARVDGTPAGTARMVLDPRQHTGKIGRVAVLPAFRSRGVGRELMEALALRALDRGLVELYLDAQVPVIPFYERLGYRAEGPEFLDAGILHRRMRRRLEP